MRVKGRACSIACDGEAALDACRSGPHPSWLSGRGRTLSRRCVRCGPEGAAAQMSDATRAVEDDRALLATVARAHHLEDQSRVEIAQVFGISRFKVTRLLKRARDEGIVSIEIHD